MGWAILAIIAGLLLADLIVRVVAICIALPMFERKLPFQVDPAPRDPDAEDVSFRSTHGVTLRGSLWRNSVGTSRGLIIFCPELGGTHWSAGHYCAGLRSAGFDVLAFDFRNQGESDRMPGYDPLHWLTDYEVDDVLAAVEYSRKRDDLLDLPLGVFGISRGGGAALAAAARCRDVRAAACEGAFSTESLLLHYTLRWAALYVPERVLKAFPHWHIRQTLRVVVRISQWRRNCRYTPLERLLGRMPPKPVLMIAGSRDSYVAPRVTKSLAAHLKEGCHGVWVVPDAKHNAARSVTPEEYDRRLVEHFSGLSTGAMVAPIEHAQP